MGDAIVGGSGIGVLTGKGPIAKALGVSGDQGEYFQGGEAPGMDMEAYNRLQGVESDKYDAPMMGKLADYGAGNQSLSNLLSNAQNDYGKDPSQMTAFQESLATNPLTGSKLATDQVQNDAVLGQLYGKGGALERANGEEQNLASRGYSLKPEDYEAYGQMSGELARAFGGRENDLAQSLNQRGLMSAPSGAAAQSYAGLEGNKFEQLAGLQRQIADQRMQMNMQRLNQTRSFMTQMGAQAQQAEQNQYGRNMAGVENAQGQRQGAVSDSMSKFQADMARWNDQNKWNLASLQDQRGAKGHTLLEGFGAGLMSSAAGIGSAPGNFVNAGAGAGGKAAGAKAFA